MTDWTGDHGFEPSIASQVKNSLPPYLLSTEAKTQVPFSATDPGTTDHLAQILQSYGRQPPGPEQPSQLVQEGSLLESQFGSGFNVTPTLFTKFLAWHLGRYAQEAVAGGVVPSDQMFQDEARRLVYGSDDPWEQTIVDSAEWLAGFRTQHLAE